jgi:hypothetical protein
MRTRLVERGVRFDFQYVSDTLWGFKSQQTPFASWSRFRATVDIDFGVLAGLDGWYFHATGLAQGGGNLGLDLGLLTGPSGLVSANTTRLDSWWIEKRWPDDRITVRMGQFAGQDFYGNAQYGSSFIISPLNYALGNLSTTLETFNPFATPAAEIRIAPIDHFYLKSMVMAGDPSPSTSNPTGLVPQFRGSPVVVSEIGFTPGSERNLGARRRRREPERIFRRLSVRSGLQSRGLHGAPEANAGIGQPSLVLEGEPSSLARRPERGTGPGCDVCARLESPECQSQLHAAHGGAALQRATASGFSQHHVAGLCAKQSEPRLPTSRPDCLANRARHRVQRIVGLWTIHGPAGVPVLCQCRWIGGDAFVGGFRIRIDFLRGGSSPLNRCTARAAHTDYFNPFVSVR